MKPDFTIITPNLNGGRYLLECLESVACQEGVAVEHILVDGGSDDDSLAIAGKFPNVRVLAGEDHGISDAINKGFDLARGDWVMWLNSDDRLKPGALRAAKEALAAMDKADLVYGAFDFVGPDGARLKTVRILPWSRFVSVHHCCYIPSTACFLRRSTVLDAGHRLREDFHYVMDGEFYARLSSVGLTFHYLPMVLADFRWHGKNQSIRLAGKPVNMDHAIAAEHQHAESRAIRRIHGFTPSEDPYLNGLSDGLLYLVARSWKVVRKYLSPRPGRLEGDHW
ncbi:MAG: glycosyltransferase family 2 protein [Verrucomicrobiales bacterium]